MNLFDDPSLGLLPLGRMRERSSSEIRASRFSVGFECLDRKLFRPEPCYDRAAGLGVKWARCQSGWCRCETERGVFQFEWLDEVIDALLARGIQPWLSLVYGNPLYMPGVAHPSAVGCVPIGFGPECRDAWRRYVQALALHFRDRVRHFEIWNEPDLPDFWVPSQSCGKNYAELLELTSRALHQVHPDAVTVGTTAKLQGDFIAEALQHGAGEWVSRWSVHPYGLIPEDGYEKRVRHLRWLFDRYAPHLALWQGECGYPHQAYDHKDIAALPMYNADEETQAKAVLRRMLLDSALDLELTSYFHIADLLENPYRSASGLPQPPTLLGLLKTRRYEPKLAWYAFRNFANLFDADCTPAPLLLDVVWPDYSLRLLGALPRLGIQTHAFVRNGYGVYVWYQAEDPQRKWFGAPGIELEFLDECPCRIEQPVLVDPLTGTVRRCTELERQGAMVRVRRLPLTDYPLIVTDRNAVEVSEDAIA